MYLDRPCLNDFVLVPIGTKANSRFCDFACLFAGTSVLTEQASDISRSGESSVDAESELKELEFRARALESLVRAREQQMNLDED